jgi:hypothetical protein
MKPVMKAKTIVSVRLLAWSGSCAPGLDDGLT